LQCWLLSVSWFNNDIFIIIIAAVIIIIMKTKFNFIGRVLFVIAFIIPVVFPAQSAQSSLTGTPGILLIYHLVKFFSILSFLLLILFRTKWITVISLLFDIVLIVMSCTYNLRALTGWFVCNSYVVFGFQLIALSIIFGWIYNRQTITKNNSADSGGFSFFDSGRVFNSFGVVFISFIVTFLYGLLQYWLTAIYETTFLVYMLNFFIPIFIVTLIFWLYFRSKTASWVVAAGFLLDISIMNIYIFVKNNQSFPEQRDAEVLILGTIILFIQVLFSIIIYLTRIRSVFHAQMKHVRWAFVTAVILIVYDLLKIYYPISPFE
jgi:hypothetical protein